MIVLIELTKSTREHPAGSILKIWGPFASEEEVKEKEPIRKGSDFVISNLTGSQTGVGEIYLLLLLGNYDRGIGGDSWAECPRMWGPFASEEEAEKIIAEEKELEKGFFSMGDKWNPQCTPEFRIFSGGITPPKDM